MYQDSMTAAAWDALRGTRCNPPARTVPDAKRRRTYVFGLEQAEQMFRAATTVGPATQPLLVFYGLSQAGRAISAAGQTPSSGSWQLQGHGITAAALEGPLPEVQVHTANAAGRGSFTRLSQLLDSPIWEKADIRLNELWDTVPDNRRFPLLDQGPKRRTSLLVAVGYGPDEPHPLATAAVAYFPPWVFDAADRRETFSKYIQSFPEARGYHSYVRTTMEPDSAPDFSRHVDGWCELQINWEMLQGPRPYEERLALLRRIARPYDGDLYLIPALGSNQRGMHPLMAWWSVLYTLSMLARYQPAEWASHIDVNSSPFAVPIERLLKRAVGILPRLILEAISQVQ